MDSLRGFEPFGSDLDAEMPAYTLYEDEDAAIEPPPFISGDERRMQVRAYNFWTSQLHGRNFPSIEELTPSAIDDFRDYSVLLDFTSGIENPSIDYLGDALRAECGLSADITYLDEVPRRSLLSRITDHYLQIIANRAPIGFEAEFVNDRGNVLMYRGILLPYSSDDDTIDFIYGVINWKEAAHADISGPLQTEVAQALAALPPRQEHVPIWADAPMAGQPDDAIPHDDVESDEPYLLQTIAPDENASLADWLDAARQCAEQARDADLRTRDALYQAIGRAYDFALIAANHPADYAELLHDAGLKAQERAPFTPIVKLVFGTGYDKTRLTEFATALQYAQHNAVPMGTFATILAGFEGGLKAIVAAERRAKKIAAGIEPATAATDDPRARLRSARKRDLSEFAGAGDEFVLLVARRDADGSVAIVGSVQGDAMFTEKALRKADV
jgi:hypothetical protein